MNPLYLFEHIDHILAGLTIIGLIISAFVTFRRNIKPLITKRKQKKIIIEGFIKELGENAPKILADNLKYLTLAIERLTAKITIITKRAQLGIYLCDEQGRCIWVNEPMAEMFGIDKEEMLGYGWLKNIIDREKAYSNWKWSIDNGTPYRDSYDVVIDGRTVNFSTEAYKHLSEDKKVPIFYIGFVEETRMIRD